jgi:tetratricopeptide (TPR) repeat protein
MAKGRRAEAAPFLEAYVAYCMERLAPQSAKEELLAIAKTALTAGVPLPVAQGLAKWQREHGGLSTQELILLGSLYYVAGRNAEALSVYESVEGTLKPGGQHTWCLITMLTALLRMDRFAEAKARIERLRADYPEAPEIDEGRYRLCAYHFDKRDLEQARECFDSLRQETLSPYYKELCDEYIRRIEHFQQVELLKAVAE